MRLGCHGENCVGLVLHHVGGTCLVELVAEIGALRRLGTEPAATFKQRHHFPAVLFGNRAKSSRVLLGMGITEHHDPLGDHRRFLILQAVLQQRIAGYVVAGALAVDVCPLVLHGCGRGDDEGFFARLTGVLRGTTRQHPASVRGADPQSLQLQR